METPNKKIQTATSLSTFDQGWKSPNPTVESVVKM